MQYAINRAEIRRYMGVRSNMADDALDRLVEQAVERIQAAATPKHVYRETALYCQEDAVVFDNQIVRGQALCTHLADCSRVIAFAATLGSEVDRVIAKDSLLHPALAVAEQAAATALLESYSDACCKELEASFLERGLRFKPRFSPGYADCPLQSQKALLDYLDAYKRIGLTLTDSCMMTPIKSISAWIGVTDRELSCSSRGCAMCDKFNCEFRNEGIFDE